MANKNTMEGRIISRRALLVGGGKLTLLCLLTSRMFYMQFIKKSEYKTLSDQNRMRMVVIPPSRGQIYDKNNNILAKNNSCFRLFLDKNIGSISSLREELKIIAEILELDDKQIQDIKNRVKKASTRIPAMIIDNLNWQQLSIIEEYNSKLNSLFIDAGNIRFYQYSEDTAHLLGYMGKINKDAKIENIAFEDENFRIGKNGIEKFYEKKLRGEFGYKQIEVNALGNYVRSLSKKPSINGHELYLNIDAQLQKKITPYLDQKGCSVVVMDCRNGGVVACNSTPSYDPNNFNSLSKEYWDYLINNPYKPLINKTIHSLYPPGSVFKLITILAALETGIDPSHIVNCDGSSFLGGNSFRCNRRRGHGRVNMHDAIMYSCNTYVFEIAKLIGPEKIISTAKKFGFGAKTDIDLPAELNGFVPTIRWKERKFKYKWSLGDTLNLSIGQGFLLCTPIQIAKFMTALATNGKLYTPRINAQSKVTYSMVDLKSEHIKFLKKALFDTINVRGGTGYSSLGYGDVPLSGKTGTAQVVAKKNANDNLSRSNIEWSRRNHAVFAGYAPSNDPVYTISVYYDHGGGGGSAAAPIAKHVLNQIFDKS